MSRGRATRSGRSDSSDVDADGPGNTELNIEERFSYLIHEPLKSFVILKCTF